ncbi:sensor histidine kinase [Parasediminibacterium paludis]|uniref:histidine kinase n=1 Tax=Parasediminibacterium paludis TaxID=908966 RepID=A0ABV8PYY3_9BACT
MKLSTKYNRINIISSILIFLVGCLVFYFVLSYVLIRQLDKSLRSERTEILLYTKEHTELPEIVNTTEQQIRFEPSTTFISKPIFASKKIWVPREKEFELLRTLTFGINVGGKNYTAIVTKSQVEAEELLKLMIVIATIMIGITIIANFTINRIILKKLWQPFYCTVANISAFQLSKKQALQLPVTKIEEFDLLNSSFNTMAKTVVTEYDTLKEFTSNAAHEMQTPLAVIANTTDALMQDDMVLENHHQSIAIIEQSVSKLSKLHQSLLLLAKIENQHFSLTETVHWHDLIAQKLQELQELITAQKIHLHTHIEPQSTQFHTHLADIIISNLLNNAIRYNIQNGSISVQVMNNQLVVSNTSLLPDLDASKVGNRFYRHPATKLNGNGLGLSIIKQICEVANYRFQYSYIAQQHIFTISF